MEYDRRVREPYYSLMYKASEGYNEHFWKCPPELLEKFADLIVLRCAEIAENTIWKTAFGPEKIATPKEVAEAIKFMMKVEQ
jgi:hypothetical protein